MFDCNQNFFNKKKKIRFISSHNKNCLIVQTGLSIPNQSSRLSNFHLLLKQDNPNEDSESDHCGVTCC